MSAQPDQIPQQPTEEEILIGAYGFLRPFGRLCGEIAESLGMTSGELAAELRAGRGDSEPRTEN